MTVKRYIREYLIVLPACLLFVIFPSACAPDQSLYEAVSSRRLEYFTEARTSFDIYQPGLLKTRMTVIDLKPVPVTRIQIDSEYVRKSIVLCHPLSLKRNHRFTGLKFSIRSLYGSCRISPVLLPDINPSCSYHCSKPIELNHSDWVTISLDFSSFTNIMTMLGLDIDVFNPVHWDRICLGLLFDEISVEPEIIEYGPVELTYEDRRYHFY